MFNLRVVLLALSSVLALLFGFVLLSPESSLVAYKFSSYWVTFFIYGVLVFAICRTYQVAHVKSAAAWMVSEGKLLFIIYLALLNVFLIYEHWGFKTIMDEPLIMCTSQGLHFDRLPLTPWRAYNVEGTYQTLVSLLDKRPIPFAFLISLVHDLFGYNIQNAYVLNNIIGALTLILCGYLGYRVYGKWGSIIAMVSMAGLPIFVLYGNGGGFDVFFIFLILLTLILALRWYETSNSFALIAFIYAGVLLCQSRYEGPIFAAAIGISLLYKFYADKKLQIPWFIVPVPLFMMLVPWIQNVFKVNEAFWELGSRPEAESVFGLSYFFPNLGKAIHFMTEFGSYYPNSPYLAILGTIAAILLVAKGAPRLVQIVKDQPGAVVWISFAGCLLGHFLLIMFYFYGQINEEPLFRFALPIFLFFVICTVGLVRIFDNKYLNYSVVLITVFGFIHYSIPTMAKGEYSDRNIYARMSDWIGEYVEDNQDKNYIVVERSPMIWFAHRISAMNVAIANLHYQKIKYQLTNQFYDDVLVVRIFSQDRSTGEWMVLDDDNLHPGFELENIMVERFQPFYAIRVDRVVDVDLDAFTEESLKTSEDDNATEQAGAHVEDAEIFQYDEDKKFAQEYYLNLP